MGAEAGSARLQYALSSQVLQVLDYISGLNPERGLSQGRCGNLECCYHCPPHKIQEDNRFATVTEILCIRITVIQYQQTGPWV